MEPISRTKLQNLHAEEVARKRNEQIKRVVEHVYRAVQYAATNSTTDKKCIVYMKDLINNTGILQDISKDVISQVEDLFPDCKVQYSKGIYTDNRRKTGEFIPISGDIVAADAHYIITVDWS